MRAIRGAIGAGTTTRASLPNSAPYQERGGGAWGFGELDGGSVTMSGRTATPVVSPGSLGRAAASAGPDAQPSEIVQC